MVYFNCFRNKAKFCSHTKDITGAVDENFKENCRFENFEILCWPAVVSFQSFVIISANGRHCKVSRGIFKANGDVGAFTNGEFNYYSKFRTFRTD